MAKIQWNNYTLRDRNPNEIVRKINVNGNEYELPNQDTVDLLDTDIPVSIIDTDNELNVTGQFTNINNIGYTPIYTMPENKHDIKYYFKYDDELRNKYLYKEEVYDMYGNVVYEKVFEENEEVLLLDRYVLLKCNIPFHKLLLKEDYILNSNKSYKEVVNMEELTLEGLKVTSMTLNGKRVVSNIQIPITLDDVYLDLYIDTKDIGNAGIELYIDNIKIKELKQHNHDEVITLSYDKDNNKLHVYTKHVLTDTIDIYTEPKDLKILWLDDDVNDIVSYTIKWMNYYSKTKQYNS